MLKFFFYGYIIYLVVLSFITFVAYFADKSKAKKQAWRTPEKVLLGMSFFGGAFGGYAAMLMFRHKTKHWYFQVVNILGLVLHAALIVFLAYKVFFA